MKDALLVSALVVLALAVGAGAYWYNAAVTTPAQQAPASQLAPVSFTTLAEGTQSKEMRRANYRITSSAELTRLWRMISTDTSIPAIDFEKNEVIAVFAGQEPTLGYSIAISKIEDGSVRNVAISISKPGASCLAGQAITSPYQIIAVPKTSLPYAHTDTVSTMSCLQ